MMSNISKWKLLITIREIKEYLNFGARNELLLKTVIKFSIIQLKFFIE